MKWLQSFVPVLLLLILMAACSSCPKKGSTARYIKADTTTVAANVGDTVAISLDYPPFSRIQWELLEYDEKSLEMIGYKSAERIENSELFRDTRHFQCLKPGSTTVKFVYRSSGGRAGTVIDSRDYTIVIK